jgi:hypothetical protein
MEISQDGCSVSLGARTVSRKTGLVTGRADLGGNRLESLAARMGKDSLLGGGNGSPLTRIDELDRMPRRFDTLTAEPRLLKAQPWRKSRARFRPQVEPLEQRTMLAVTPGTWQSVATPIPDPGGAQTMMLLSDGSVMVQGGADSASKDWYQLTPDSTGSYVNGSWTQLASSSVERLFAPMAMLTNGDVMLMGGEYSGPTTQETLNNTGEVYDPVANTWTSTATFPQSMFGDDPIETLPNGNVLAGYISGPQTYIYSPSTNTWSQTGTKLRNDQSDEESWVKLPDGSILSYDVFSSAADGVGHAQRYIPSTGQWVDASNGTLPVLSDPPPSGSSGGDDAGAEGYELGPAFLLPNGNAIFFGVNGNTAIYNPTTNLWSAGPAEPQKALTITDDANGDGIVTAGGPMTNLVMADAPGAMMPNGDILVALSPQGSLNSTSGAYDFPAATYMYEFDPVANTFTEVTPTTPDWSNTSSFSMDMLVLPSGQVMVTDENGTIEVYTPNGSPQPSWQPQITSITGNGTTTFQLSGTLLNGISEGADYGDDSQEASNYPILQFTDAAGNVSYARTYNWSSTGVQTGSTVETADFTLPPTFTPGSYTIKVIANGIASPPLVRNFGGPTAADDSASTVENVPVTIDVLANDTANFYAINPASVQIVTAPANGSVQINPANGAVTYTPNPDFVGNDSFQYTVADIHGNVSNVANVSIRVDQPPIAENDLAVTQPGVPVTINVLSNDFSTLNTIVPSTLKIVQQPLDGTAAIVNGQVVYTPLAGYIGGDSFQYTVADNLTHVSNVATVNIRIGDAVSLSGIAYVDANGDGIEDDGEVGIPDATIELTKTDGNYKFSTFALTDATGAYHFAEGSNYVMPAGTYNVKEINPGFYVPGTSTMGTPPAAGPNTNGEFDGITLAPDQEATGYDFGSKGLSAVFAAAYFNRRAFLASTGPKFDGLNLQGGPNWISFDSGVQGTLTALAQFNPALGNVTMALLDSNMNVVATSAVSGGQAELSFNGQSSTPYFLEVTGSNPNVTLNTYASGAPAIAPPTVAQFHNAVIPADVNGDGVVSALDALAIINDLNAGKGGSLASLVGMTSSMVDVNDDGILSALDALTVINDLNSAVAASAAVVGPLVASPDSPAPAVTAPLDPAPALMSPVATSTAGARVDTSSVAFALAVAQTTAQASPVGASAVNAVAAGGPPTGAASNSPSSSASAAGTSTAGPSIAGTARSTVRPASSSQLANLIWTDEEPW